MLRRTLNNGARPIEKGAQLGPEARPRVVRAFGQAIAARMVRTAGQGLKIAKIALARSMMKMFILIFINESRCRAIVFDI